MMCLRLLPFCVRLGECKTTACIAFWASSCRHLRHHAYADTKKFPRKDFPAYSIRALIDCHSRSIDRLNCFRFCAAILYDVLVFYLSVFRDGTGDCLSFILFFSYDCDFLYFFFSVWFFFFIPILISVPFYLFGSDCTTTILFFLSLYLLFTSIMSRLSNSSPTLHPFAMETGCYWLYFSCVRSIACMTVMETRRISGLWLGSSFQKRTFAQPLMSWHGSNPRCLGQPYSIPIDTNGSLLFYGDDGPFMPN